MFLLQKTLSPQQPTSTTSTYVSIPWWTQGHLQDNSRFSWSPYSMARSSKFLKYMGISWCHQNTLPFISPWGQGYSFGGCKTSLTLEKRTILRDAVVHFLLINGLRYKNAVLVYPFLWSEKLFLDMPIKCFEIEASCLLKLYEEKRNLAYTRDKNMHVMIRFFRYFSLNTMFIKAVKWFLLQYLLKSYNSF